MTDEYEAALSREQIEYLFVSTINEFEFALAIERAAIEAYRAKHLPELNLQRAYEIQRDELMAARMRITELEASVRGLPIEQEPKYTVSGSHIINRASGEPIPHDEPVFIFRARDKYAAPLIGQYWRCLENGPHSDAVRRIGVVFIASIQQE